MKARIAKPVLGAGRAPLTRVSNEATQVHVFCIGFGDLARRVTQRVTATGGSVSGLRRTVVSEPGVAMHSGDCRDSDLLTTLLPGHDLVIVSLTPDTYSAAGYRDAYVAPARALHQAIARLSAKPPLVLWVSSTSVYGDQDGQWVDETTPPQPQTASAQALLEAETIIADCATASAVVRFSGIYGRGSTRLLDQVKAGRCAPATPEHWSNRIHGDDCAGVLHHLALRYISGTALDALYLASDCQPTPLHQVHRWLAEQLNVPFICEQPTTDPKPNRRCNNQRLLDTGYAFTYPTFQEGYRQVVAEEYARG